jgi:transposase
LVDSVMEAQNNLKEAGSQTQIEEVAADKGYHAAHTLELSEAGGLRTYIPEPRRRHRLRWTDKPAACQPAVYANRRRIKRATSKRWQRRRSELCERTFAHVCDRGGTRRRWLCVEKRSAEFVQIGSRHVLASGGSAGRSLAPFLPLGACSP